MSKRNSIFTTVPMRIPDRSGFDLSHEHIFTATTGTLVPAASFEVLPGDKVSLGSLFRTTLPPFAVPFMGRIDACMEAFFVPHRIIWKAWESFITQNNGVSPMADGTIGTPPPISVPVFLPNSNPNMLGSGTLADYLGFKLNQGTTPPNVGMSALKFLAYHKICDDWYRDDNNVLPFFAKNPPGILDGGAGWSSQIAVIPRVINSFSAHTTAGEQDSVTLSLNVPSASSVVTHLNKIGVDASIGLGSLRQRSWAKDYFTTATPQPQAGAASSVAFDTSGSTGQFTIASLRAANSLQKWMERNNIAGTRYGDQILAHFGVLPPSAVMDRAILLGSCRTPVIVGSVENNSNAEASTKNGPFGNTLGSAAGFGSATDKGSLIDSFDVKEHGFVFVMYSLVPHSYYNSGFDREFRHVAYGDFAWPEFSNIGDQPILAGELSVEATNPLSTFAYNQRYSEYKAKLDRISGLLSDMSSAGGTTQLSAYALQRGFSGDGPALGKQFLEIPTDYLDQVFAVSAGVSGFSCLVDCYFDCSILRVLPEYSLPSL
nr:MAG: major capsid protein [Microviridae sp.]